MSATWDGKVIFVVIVAVVLAAIAGRIVAARYRRRVLALMSGGAPPSDAVAAGGRVPAASPAPPVPSTTSGTLAQNRRARHRLALAVVAISLAIGLSQAWFGLAFVYTEGGYGPIKLLVMGLLYAWVMVPALGLLWRWSGLRSAAWSVAYMGAVGVLVWLRSTEGQQLWLVLGWLSTTILPPLLVFVLAFSGNARATSPHLLPIFLLLAGSSVLGTDMLERMMRSPSGAGMVTWLLGFVPPTGVFGLFIFAPWVLMGWPAWRSARLLAAGYVAKRFSEPVYLLGGIWLVALLMEALSASHGIGAGALWVMACWLWIPLGMRSLRGWLAPPAGAPMLLVLRVFRRDAEVRALFDDVVEAWRHSGPSCLIAGTDLALRTLEPDELFAFVSGRLHERFIGSEASLARRIGSLDLAADPDGRFRVNEFYCFDSTWRQALDGLVAHSDVVLMDLRGLHAENLGSLHELRVLTRASRVRRIVLLFNEHTDRDAAHGAVGTYDARFIWHDARQRSRGAADRVLGLLLEGSAQTG
ncbi:MAG TPA: hypothetical protein VMT97_08220 [Terriglobales bacterium]|nr:hypothetical protein [Terriglobales bacterium]